MFELYFTLAVLVGILVLLALDITGPDAVFGGALIVLLFGGVVSPEEALAGFSNKGMITVGLLFIVSRAVENTGVFQLLADRFLGDGGATVGAGGAAGTAGAGGVRRAGAGAVLKMMAPVTTLSAFLNNIPIVTIFTPVVKRWTASQRLPVGKFLIPLSYAAIFGGVCTLIGTSTNLVVHGLMLENGLEGFRFFELARAGVPIGLFGYAYLAVVGRLLLPERYDELAKMTEQPREYFIEMLVPSGSSLIGKTVDQARLRRLQSVYLTDIEREGDHLGPVTPDRRLAAGDRLFFAGRTDGVADLVTTAGLEPVDQQTLAVDTAEIRRHLVEVVVSGNCAAVGRTIRDSNFRSLYDAAVVAVSRNGERLNARLGDVELHEGDTLVLLAKSNFARRYRFSREFLLVSTLDRIAPEAKGRGAFALAVVAVMVVLAATGRLLPTIGGNRVDMFYAAAAAAALLILGRTIRPGQAREAVRWDVLVTIGAAFGVSRALLNSGAAELVGHGLVQLMAPFGPVGALAAVFLATVLFTELITNNAAAALMFPIAFVTASSLGVEPTPFFVAIAIAASASFATPIGYQTNLIVQGPGGYRFRDFLRVGLPMDAIAAVVGVTAIALWYMV